MPPGSFQVAIQVVRKLLALYILYSMGIVLSILIPVMYTVLHACMCVC